MSTFGVRMVKCAKGEEKVHTCTLEACPISAVHIFWCAPPQTLEEAFYNYAWMLSSQQKNGSSWVADYSLLTISRPHPCQNTSHNPQQLLKLPEASVDHLQLQLCRFTKPANSYAKQFLAACRLLWLGTRACVEIPVLWCGVPHPTVVSWHSGHHPTGHFQSAHRDMVSVEGETPSSDHKSLINTRWLQRWSHSRKWPYTWADSQLVPSLRWMDTAWTLKWTCSNTWVKRSLLYGQGYYGGLRLPDNDHGICK